MNVIVVGGGKVGYYLTKTLISEKHKVVVIEKDRERCNRLVETLETIVIHGDGTDVETLGVAKADKTTCLVAVTGKDEVNLVACQLASKHFDIARTIARVNNPKNQEVFACLGVNATVSSTALIARIVDDEVVSSDIRTLLMLNKGELSLLEATIKEGSGVVGKPVKDVPLPSQCVLVSVIRSGKVLIPRGDTVLMSQDEVLAITDMCSKNELSHLFTKNV